MASKIRYYVLVLPLKHEIEVTLTVESDAAVDDGLLVENAAWVPGNYSFAPFGRDVFELQAFDAAGKPLTVFRAGWQAYRVYGAGRFVRITYRANAYCLDFGESCGLVDGEFGLLLGTRYLRIPSVRGPCSVQYVLPPNWKIHHPSGAAQISENAWEYSSYEILLDTPVAMGRFSLLQRKVEGTQFYFVFVDRTIGYEQGSTALVDAISAAAAKVHEVFGYFPFQDYTFFLSFNPTSSWGLEHLSSSMCGIGPDVFVIPDQFKIAVRVCAHELFHAWNVRRLRPTPLKNPDLEHGSFTQGLWIAEGFTRYYEFLICTRTGLYSVFQFLSTITGYYTHLTATPAYKRVSAVDSSLATYLNHNKYSGRCNTAIDYYDIGMVIAFTLDAHLRLTNGGDSLDKAFRAFYEAFAGVPTGYTISDFVDFMNQRCPGAGDLVARQSMASAALQFESTLVSLGFQVTKQTVPYLGLMFLNSIGRSIYGVLDDSPAAGGGLAPDDQLQSINGYPFTAERLKWAATHCDVVTLQVLRGHRTVPFTIRPALREQIFQLTWIGSPAQAEKIADWTSQTDFHLTAGQAVSLDFHENVHGIEIIV